ncbi:LmbE family N-acetylglucosaminyl deacetylase [Conyzicola nivalis]|uniref:LmbE family N-acetylglucosaminyl deacetylase n=1 Tax=Conyzicola nivalis TaxID=1477021 RepID=A0ABV2QM03_9MICO
MVTFDSRLPGTNVDVWQRDGRLADVPALELSGIRRLVVVGAHPDDETLGAGALIAECAAAGIDVTVVVVTDGGASHPDSPSTTPEHLRRLRGTETLEAMRHLAPEAVVHSLDFPDGAVREHRDEIATALRVHLSGDDVLLAAPWRGDGHRDHRVLGEICASLADEAGVALLEYPVWLWHWAAPDDDEVPWDAFVALAPSRASLDAKRRAIGEYTSQTLALGDGPGDEAVLHPEFLRNFRGDREVYVGRRRAETVLDQSYFDALYRRHDDPWGFTSRWYERRKRAATLAALPEERFASAFEIGCSIGVLTEQLAGRCDSLLAVDVSQAAVDRARLRLAAQANVRVGRVDVASAFPSGDFDLIVLSEVGYYFTLGVLERVLDDAVDALSAGGTFVACHWRHQVDDYALTGDEVHSAIATALDGRMTRMVRHEEDDFLLDVYSPDPRSVAVRTGIL